MTHDPDTVFCLQKEGGISSLKVETLDPSLGQYDVVWLLDRGEAEGAWQLGQVTSYLVIYNYIYNHTHVSAGEHHGAEHRADRGAGGGAGHRLRRRGRLPRVRRRGQVRHPARGGEVSCDWSSRVLTSDWLQGGPAHHHHRPPRRQVPRLQLRDGRVRVELGRQHRQHHRHVPLHQVQTHNISSTITNMFPLTRSKGKLHQDGDGPTHDHNENTEGNNMDRMRLEL